MSYALIDTPEDAHRVKTNTGNTKLVMALLSEMWIVHLSFIMGALYIMTFVVQQGYTDSQLWTDNTWYKVNSLQTYHR